MLVVTTNDIPDWKIQHVCGEVFGLTVRSRNAFAQMGGHLTSPMSACAKSIRRCSAANYTG